MKTNVKKIAKAAILGAAISGGTLMFVTPFEAQAYSGGGNKSRVCYYASPDVVYCTAHGVDCVTAVGCL